MPSFETRSDVPFTPRQCFDVVADIEHYPSFVPGYKSARIISRAEGQLEVIQTVGLGPAEFSFASTARLAPPCHLVIESHEWPFTRMHVDWRFTASAGGSTIRLRAELQARFGLGTLLAPMWETMHRRLVAAFVAEAGERYGSLLRG